MDVALWQLWCCCRKKDKKMVKPNEYGWKSQQYEIAPVGDPYWALVSEIRNAGGKLQLHPAIGEGLGKLTGCFGNWPGPTYHKFHPALDFASDELQADLLALKSITPYEIMARSTEARQMRILPGPKVGPEMALDMFETATAVMAANNGRCTLIKPLGPADWLEPLRDKFIESKVDLTNYAYGNMDEFTISPGSIVPENHPLSFRGMIDEQFITPLVEHCGLKRENVKIPNPYNIADYEQWLAERGVDACYGGIGWGGHFAFIDPSTGLVWELYEEGNLITVVVRPLGFDEMSQMGIMEVSLDAVSNMQTALHSGGGNWYEALTSAYSIGLKQVLMAKRISVWMDGFVLDDQTWQRWIAKAAAFLPKFTALLPCTATLACEQVDFNFASQVAQQATSALH